MDLHSLVLAGKSEKLKSTLVDDNNNIESKDALGFTPLHLACSLGNVEIVEILLQYKANVHAETEDRKSTPLHIAVEYGRKEVVSKLLQWGAASDIEKGDHEMDTVLHIAALRRNSKLLEQLYNTMDVCLWQDWNLKNKYGQTPLFYAAGMGCHEEVKYLLDRKADKALIDSAGLLPFHFAAKRGDVRTMSLLMLRGDEKSKKGFTALHYASWNGCENAVQWLLKKNVVPLEGKDDFQGDTALHLAARKGSTEVAKLLVEEGADIYALNKNDENPFFLADKLNHSSVIRGVFDCVKAIKSLNPLLTDIKKATLLHYVSAFGNEKEVDLVIRRIRKTHLPSVNSALNFQKIVNMKDCLGRTALHWAAGMGNKKAIGILKRSKVQLMSIDDTGITPLSYALVYGHLHCAMALSSSLNSEEFVQWITDWAQEMEGIIKHRKDLPHDVLNCISTMPPLWIAFKIGQKKAAKFIIEEGKKKGMRVKDIINWEDKKNQRTTLHWATILKDSDIVAHLCRMIECKEELLVNLEDKFHKTALHYAIEMGLEDIRTELMCRDDVKIGVERLSRHCRFYVDGLNALVVGATLIASVTFSACIHPPVGPNYFAFVSFWILNILSFLSAVATIIFRGAAVFYPKPRIRLSKSVPLLRFFLLIETILFGCSICFALGAFVAASFLIIPTLSNHKPRVRFRFSKITQITRFTTIFGVIPFFLCLMVFLRFMWQEIFCHVKGGNDIFEIQRVPEKSTRDPPPQYITYVVGRSYEEVPWDDGLDKYDGVDKYEDFKQLPLSTKQMFYYGKLPKILDNNTNELENKDIKKQKRQNKKSRYCQLCFYGIVKAVSKYLSSFKDNKSLC